MVLPELLSPCQLPDGARQQPTSVNMRYYSSWRDRLPQCVDKCTFHSTPHFIAFVVRCPPVHGTAFFQARMVMMMMILIVVGLVYISMKHRSFRRHRRYHHHRRRCAVLTTPPQQQWQSSSAFTLDWQGRPISWCLMACAPLMLCNLHQVEVGTFLATLMTQWCFPFLSFIFFRLFFVHLLAAHSI